MTEQVWGYELLIDLGDCDKSLIKLEQHLINYAKTLVDAIKMKAFGEPWVKHFAIHDIDKAGYTLFQPIETSSITGHFCDSTGDAYINIHSCMPFDEAEAIEVTKNFFHPKTIKSQLILRKALKYND